MLTNYNNILGIMYDRVDFFQLTIPVLQNWQWLAMVSCRTWWNSMLNSRKFSAETAVPSHDALWSVTISISANLLTVNSLGQAVAVVW